jgi:hypothetical protein
MMMAMLRWFCQFLEVFFDLSLEVFVLDLAQQGQ